MKNKKKISLCKHRYEKYKYFMRAGSQDAVYRMNNKIIEIYWRGDELGWQPSTKYINEKGKIITRYAFHSEDQLRPISKLQALVILGAKAIE